MKNKRYIPLSRPLLHPPGTKDGNDLMKWPPLLNDLVSPYTPERKKKLTSENINKYI